MSQGNTSERSESLPWKELLAQRWHDLQARVEQACQRAERDPATVTIIAVTKSVAPIVATEIIRLGCRDLAENRPQELWRKVEQCPPARWHMIGHLQRNKLDRTIPLVSYLHSADSERLLESLAAFGATRPAPVRLLLEVNISGEANKGGWPPEQVYKVLNKFQATPGLDILGLMGMAAYSEDPEAARPAFLRLQQLRDELRQTTGLALPELSIGMSGDFEVAIEVGATMIRPGTVLFEGLESIGKEPARGG